MKVIQQNLPSLLLLILSIQIILGYYTISEVNAQIDQTENLTNQSQSLQVNPGTIEPQPLKDARTGVDQKFPGKLIGILDPNTGQIITDEVQLTPKVTGPSVVGNSQASGLFGRASPETGLGGFGAPVNPNGVLTNEGLGTELLFSTSSPVLTPGYGEFGSLISPAFENANSSLPSISEILNDTSDIIDWPRQMPQEAVIAIKVVKADETINDQFSRVYVDAFHHNQNVNIGNFPSNHALGLYHFIHIPVGSIWEPPSIPVGVSVSSSSGPVNYTTSPMCTSYAEVGKLYKCTITLR